MAILPIWAARSLWTAFLVVAAGLPGYSQTAESEFTSAYQALAAKNYDTAIASFRAALRQEPENVAAHKDLAYTLLKTGDNAEARDEFQIAVRLHPNDDTAALEFAFLAFETQQPIEARRTFDRLRKHAAAAATRATAEQAFQNIDKPLAAGIERWQQALSRSQNPNDPALFSAHWELAQLAENRDNLPLAADQYAICFHLKPERLDILLALARCWRQLNRLEDAHAALLAAGRCSQPRTAEAALEELGPRYPYAYEFVNALALTPRNTNLRRELAYLYLAVGKQAEAIEQFKQVLAIDPADRLSRDQLDALTPTTTSAAGPDENKVMGLKSFALGYSRDAIHYLRLAHEDDPGDAEIMLKLGYAYNYAKNDPEAIKWFDQARHSGDSLAASEAEKAYRNLTQTGSTLTTIWSLPMYSSRWHDVFDYGQVKRALQLPWPSVNRWLSVYASARFSGDWKSNLTAGEIAPQYLSDSAIVFGAGVASRTWHHLTGWAEAGESINYLPFRHDEGTASPDYRGGLNFAKGFGHLLGAGSPGLFFETTADAVYISRYGKDWIFNAQNRTGRTFHLGGGSSAQLLWNVNLLHDLKDQYWAETVETGPGLRLHMPWMRPNVYFSTDFLRGAYTNNLGNPRRPNYDDIRVGFWYALSK